MVYNKRRRVRELLTQIMIGSYKLNYILLNYQTHLLKLTLYLSLKLFERIILIYVKYLLY